jgi:hypothetical protein
MILALGLLRLDFERGVVSAHRIHWPNQELALRRILYLKMFCNIDRHPPVSETQRFGITPCRVRGGSRLTDREPLLRFGQGREKIS